MKKSIHFYRHWYGNFKISILFPRIYLSKNVQGWHFTRTLTVQFIGHAMTIFLTKIDNINLDRSSAHDLNVVKYMRHARMTPVNE